MHVLKSMKNYPRKKTNATALCACAIPEWTWHACTVAHLGSDPSAMPRTNGLWRLKNASGNASSQSCLLMPPDSGSPLGIAAIHLHLAGTEKQSSYAF